MVMANAGTAQDGAVHNALRDQLVAALPPATRVRANGWRPWASASFAGARHWFDLTSGVGECAEIHARNWSRLDWELAGSFVADCTVTQDEAAPACWQIELLTVDD